MGFPLTEEQKAVVEDIGGELLVSAAAGSGKTRVLVERLLTRVLEEELDIDSFLVITFTNAAAAELRARIVDELAQRLAQEPNNRHLRRQTTLVYKTQISTIHAFCIQIIRESGHLLDLDPDFRLCDDHMAGALRLQAIEEVLEDRYQDLQADSPFAQLIETMSAGRDDSRLAQIALDIHGKVQAHAHPSQWLEQQRQCFALEGITDVGETQWGGLILEQVGRICSYWQAQLDEAIGLCDLDDQLAEKYSPSYLESAQAIEGLGEAVGISWDTAVSCAQIPFSRLGGVRGCESPELQEKVKAIRERCKKRMKAVTELLDQTSAVILSDMAEVYPAIVGLLDLVEDFGKAYTILKRQRGLVDFADLEHLAVALLVEGDKPSQLALSLRHRFTELMVDEYQDTNQVQNTIFQALSKEGTNLFQVGDVKQSVYRFRLADPTIFLEKYRSFVPGDQAEEGQPRGRVLSKNFRSRPQVLEGANFLFRNLMSTDFGEMDYGDSEALYPGAEFPGNPTDYQVEFDAVDLDQGEVDEGSGKPNKDFLEARFVAKRISELLEEGFPVTQGKATRPVRSGDIVVLLRSPNPILHHYAKAFEERNIPWEADGGEDFFQSIEVSIALSYLQIIDNPRQDVPLISVLRSPLYGFSADRLAVLRAGQKEGDFYSCLLQAQEEPDCQAFLAELNQLRERACDLSCHQLLWQIYDQSNLMGIFGAMEEGESHRGRLLALAECARQYEGGGHKGLFGFLTHLGRVREQGGKLSGASSGQAGAGVRIMSIHRSKGLEFPVVVLAGLSKLFNLEDLKAPILFHPHLGIGPKGLDQERMIYYPTIARKAVKHQLKQETLSEELRLLYVALTRAKEKLMLCCGLRSGVKDVQRLALEAQCPVNPQVLSDCTSVSQWLLLALLSRPDASQLREAGGVDVSLTQGDCGFDWDIRWVDGSSLLQLPEKGQQTQVSQQEERTLDEDLLAQLRWQYPHQTEVDLPSKLTATQVKGRVLDMETTENSPQPPRAIAFERPSFAQETLGLTPAQRGSALHLAMQYLDFHQSQSREGVKRQLSQMVARQLMSQLQAEAVNPAPVVEFLQSPLGQEVLQAQQIHREWKFSLLVPASDYYPQANQGEEVLFQGVVDCWFETLEGITIIDFKSDRVTAQTIQSRAQSYRPQLEAYAKALADITGRPVVRKVLWFFGASQEILL